VQGEPTVALYGHAKHLYCSQLHLITPGTIKREALLRFDGKNGYANAPQCNVVRNLVIFVYILLTNTSDVPSSMLAS
jgi:hypothetical protein